MVPSVGKGHMCSLANLTAGMGVRMGRSSWRMRGLFEEGPSRPEQEGQRNWLLENPLASRETCKGSSGSTECFAGCPEGLRHRSAQSTMLLRPHVGPESFDLHFITW